MLEKITQFFRDVNNAATGNQNDKLFRCGNVRNAPHYLTANKDPQMARMWQALASSKAVAPGEGIIAKEALFARRVTPQAAAIENAVRLLTASVAKAGVYSACSATHSGHDNSPAGAITLPGYLDRAVDSLLQQCLPWQPVKAQNEATHALETAASLSDSAGHHYRSGHFHLRHSQQMDKFLHAINLPLDHHQRQRLMADLQQAGMALICTTQASEARRERAHENEMRARVMLHELSLTEQRVSGESIGARLISWGEGETASSHALFMQGVKSGKVEYLLAAGLRAIIGKFSQDLGEVFTGEIFDRQPGETSGERVVRLSNYLLAQPEANVAKVFRFQPGAAIKPLPRLDGLVIAHPPSAIHFQTVLQAEIGGQRWRLIPQGGRQAVAVPPAHSLSASRAATLNPHNHRWQIENMPGEYRFTWDPAPGLFVKNSDGYFPVSLSPDDGTLLLADGQKIFFNQHAQQWMPFYAGNSHLHAKCLNVIPESALTPEPGRQGVLTTTMGSERRVWRTPQGKYFLEIRSAADSPGKEHIRYLEGWPEGDFFTLKSPYPTPVYQQAVLQWQPVARKWHLAASPFSQLKQAESRVDPSWLQQQATPERLEPVAGRPGLYHVDHRYLLRWFDGADGQMSYLELLPTAHPADYLPEQAGADDLRFHYDENASQWQIVPQQLQAFVGLPEQIKVKPDNPFSASYGLPGYRHTYRSRDEIFIHIGHDNQGRAEYIPVVQEEGDSELFSLRALDENGADTRWLFRYQRESDEFTRVEKRLCQRVKRADDQSCVGASELSLSDRAWFNWHPQGAQESNLDYARRLYHIRGNRPVDSAIAQHTGIDAGAFSRYELLPMQQQPLRDEETQWLRKHPRRQGEMGIDYALRLLAARESELQQELILNSTIDKKSIADYCRVPMAEVVYTINIETVQWLTRHARIAAEWPETGENFESWQKKNVAYARRLLQLRQFSPNTVLVSVDSIARHAQLAPSILHEGLAADRAGWLNSLPRIFPEETDPSHDALLTRQKNQCYARRLADRRDQQQLSWLVSDKDIAAYAGVTMSLLREARQPAFSHIIHSLLQTRANIEVLPDNRLLRRQWEDCRPLLVDASDPTRSLTHQLLTPPHTVEMMRPNPPGVPRRQWHEIKQRFKAQARALIESDGKSMQAFSQKALRVVMDEQHHDVGWEIQAAEGGIPAWTFLGGYSGVWHDTEASLQNEFRKMGSERVLTYLWGSQRRGAVSGLQHANKLALINTGEIRGFPRLGENKVGVGFIDGLLPFYYTLKDIEEGEQLLIDYGEYYNPKYAIQTTMNNDVINIAAKSEGKYIVIHGWDGNISAIYSPQGALSELPAGAQAVTLQERMDDRFIIRYDVISKKNKKKIKIKINNSDHLYYALAKALDENGGNVAIKAKVDQLKAAVAAAHPEEQPLIKTEPADG